MINFSIKTNCLRYLLLLIDFKLNLIMKCDIFFILLIIHTSFYAQKQTANWYFGDNAGIKFTDTGVVVLTNSVMKAREGTATISDKNGNLLFYTKGITVFNKNHQVMINGMQLEGSPSNSQCLIIPSTSDSNQYYIIYINSFNFTLPNPLMYSIVDFNLFPLGIVTKKNILILEDYITEGVSVVKHCNQKDFWLIGVTSNKFGLDNHNYFYTILISSKGEIYSTKFTKINFLNDDYLGYVKTSISGNKIAIKGGVVFADFDNSTGKITNILKASDEIHEILDYAPGRKNIYYSIEFSSNGKFLYNNDGYRINTLTGDVVPFLQSSFGFSGLQLGLDNKIYISNSDDLSVIHNPNAESIDDINYEKNSIYLEGRNGGGSITNFAPFLFDTTPIFKYSGECVGEEINLYFEDSLGLDSAKWILDDGNLVVKGFSTQYTFNEKGNHSVEFISFKNGISDTLQQCVTIYGVEKGFLGPDTTVCSHKPIRLSAQYPAIGNYLWNTGESTGSIVIDTLGEYWVEVKNNCATYTDTIVVNSDINCTTSLIQFPNIITPNNDGLNDYLSVLTISNEINPQYLSYTIFNRWGKIIYQNSPITAPWDGNTNGNPAPAGTYFYSVQYLENIIKNGYVLLVR